MNTIQSISIDFNCKSNIQQAFYCPFTGIKIVSEDPFKEMDENEYPNSVFAVWISGDSLEFDLPVYTNSDFTIDTEIFHGIDSFEDFLTILEKSNLEGDFLVVNLKYYGSLSGDFGNFCVLLKIPQHKN